MFLTKRLIKYPATLLVCESCSQTFTKGISRSIIYKNSKHSVYVPTQCRRPKTRDYTFVGVCHTFSYSY